MTLYYPDVSNNNWGSTQDAINFLGQLAGEGFSAVAHKVSQGSGYRDAYWPAVRDWCGDNGLLAIGYHYVDTSDPAAQAQCFVANGGGDVAMLDFEANSGDIANYWAVVNAFNAAGVHISLSYIPHWYWQQIGSPDLTGVPGLVSSSYPGGDGYASTLYWNGGGDQGAGWNSYGNATPAAWQFTDQALVAGIKVDCNAFRGSLDDLKALFAGTPPAPPAPAPLLPIMFTVEGHCSDMFAGPVADTATQLEQEGICHHQPIGYNNAAIPFDNDSGTKELARLVGATVMDNGVPFPAGTPWSLGIFSQGSIVGFDFYVDYLAPGKPLNWRLKDLVGVLAYGNPCRQTDSIAPWAASWITTTGTHGLDPYKRFGLTNLPAKPDNWIDVYREGDIFAENGDDQASACKAAVYQAVARGDVFSNPYSLAAQIADVFKQPINEVVGIVQAIISGVSFLADQPNPHYSPYDITGGIDWMRGRLTATAAAA